MSGGLEQYSVGWASECWPSTPIPQRTQETVWNGANKVVLFAALVAIVQNLLQVVLQTPSAMYECMKPAASYRKLFSPLEEQLRISHQVRTACICHCPFSFSTRRRA